MNKLTTHFTYLGLIEKLIRSVPIIYVFFRSIVKYTNYFEEDFKCLKKIFKDKKLNIIDVGASDGIACKFFLNNLNVNKVLCFEPQKTFFRELDNFRKKHRNIKIFKYGLGVNKKHQILFVPYVLFFKKKFYLSTYNFTKKKELLKQIKTDFFISPKIEKIRIRINKFKKIKFKIDLIKIDTNGSELDVILALKEIIKKDRPTLIIENNDIKNISNYLKKLQYQRYYFSKGNLLPHKKEKSLNVIFKVDQPYKYLRDYIKT